MVPFFETKKYSSKDEVLKTLNDAQGRTNKSEKIITSGDVPSLLAKNALSPKAKELYRVALARAEAPLRNATTRSEMVDMILKATEIFRDREAAVTVVVDHYLQEAARFKQKQASEAPLHEFTGQLSEIAVLLLLADHRTVVLKETLERQIAERTQHLRQIASKPRPNRKSTFKAAVIEAMHKAREQDELFKDYLLQGGCGATVDALPGDYASDMQRMYRIEVEGFEPETKSGRTLSGWWNEAGKKSHTD